MFYQCPKCKNIWNYPLRLCLNCFLPLKKISSNKEKVRSSCRVNIPTILHPKVSYFVLLLEDGNGNKWVQKSFKERKIGEEISPKKASEKESDVVILRIRYDILEGIERIFKILDVRLEGLEKVLILPSLTSPSHPYLRENTSPQWLEILIKFLLENGLKKDNIKVGGQSFNFSLKEILKKSKILDVCQKLDVEFLDFSKRNFKKKEMSEKIFEISKDVLSSSLIINLPILKIGKVSALENIFSILKKDNYFSLKYLFTDKEIFKNLRNFLPPILTIAQGDYIQTKTKFVVYLNLILGSFNLLSLERIFFEIIPQKEIPEALMEIKLENVRIIGRELEEVKMPQFF